MNAAMCRVDNDRRGLDQGLGDESEIRELAHLVLAPAGEVDSEKAAHRFAAAFLVPGDTARRELGIVSRRTAASQLADMRAWGWEDAEPSEGVAAAKYRRAWSGWCFALSRRAR